MDIIICIIYIFIGVRWIFKNIRLGTFSACTTWKIMGLKLFMLLMVPLALFVYVYFADNLTQRLFLGMLVIILGQIEIIYCSRKHKGSLLILLNMR